MSFEFFAKMFIFFTCGIVLNPDIYKSAYRKYSIPAIIRISLFINTLKSVT